MRNITVAAAVITRSDGRIFATQRGYGDYKDYWEFPGGKLEPGETPEQALRREIQEELATQVSVDEPIGVAEMDYPDFHLVLHCFWCHVEHGHLDLLEAEDARWLTPEQLPGLHWLPADAQLVPLLRAPRSAKSHNP